MKLKPFVMGLTVGAVIASSITIYASIRPISVYKYDSGKIMLDNAYLPVPSSLGVLNYNNYTYSPVRLIAEALGAKVDWDQITETVKITSPQPEVVEKEVDRIVEKVVEVPLYQEAPFMNTRKGFEYTVLDVSVNAHELTVWMNVKTDYTNFIEMFIYEDRASVKWDEFQYYNRLFSANLQTTISYQNPKDWSVYTEEEQRLPVNQVEKGRDFELIFPYTGSIPGKFSLLLPVEYVDLADSTKKIPDVQIFHIDLAKTRLIPGQN